MSDKIFYPLAVLAAIAMIGLALVWPQGIGARSPEPFGHEIVLPDYYRMLRERDARERKAAEDRAARDAARRQSAAASVSSGTASESSVAP